MDLREEILSVAPLRVSKVRIYTILCLLDANEPLYQSQVLENIGLSSSSGSRTYLYKLEKIDCVRGYRDYSKDPRKKFYKITDKGNGAMEELEIMMKELKKPKKY